MDLTNEQIRQRAQVWLGNSFDEATRKQVQLLLDGDPKELTEHFYRTLEFGTGGLRGIMGAGTNRMNKYTVGTATQGLANYLKKQFTAIKEIKVAIAYDCRNNSPYFAQIIADVFTANGIKVYLFESLRPTPQLSFAIRHYGCQSGVMVTASHNPKEYNGYKAYWDDGGQVTAPHDTNIIDEVNAIQSIDDVKFSGNPDKVHLIGEELDKIYLDKLASLSMSPDAIKRQKDMKIVYTPLHGTGVKLVPDFLHLLGFENIIHVPEQDVNDGDFPTLISPNPEESSALKMALDKAEATSADLVMATDPDADRVGIAVRNHGGALQLLNGNQTAAILTYYFLRKWKDAGKLTGKEYIVKTIVTTDLLFSIAKHFNVEHFNVLTGFKFIAEIIREHEGKKTFICGGEESYGFLVGDYVRDKDAVVTCGMVAETAAWAKEEGKSLYDLLLDIYIEFGFYQERLLSITKKGKDGVAEIQQMMKSYRENPPAKIDGSPVVTICDYLKQDQFDISTGKHTPIQLPKSDVLQFITQDGTIVSVRPSGTEPKIKFYFGMRGELKNKDAYASAEQGIAVKYERILSELKLK